MTLDDLEDILNKDMKLGKARDIYKLTVEHLSFAGNEVKLRVLNLVNDIIDSIYFLTCSQVKKGLSTNVY